MFYDRFIELCKKVGTAPSKVAEEANFNKGSVSVWKKKFEQGVDIKPSTEILEKISDYFEVSIDYLLGNTEPNNQILKDDDIKVALFGGDGEVTDEMWEEVKAFAEFVKEKNRKKNDND